MLIVACRNRDRMKEVVKNFLKLEIRTAAELLLDVWDIYGASPFTVLALMVYSEVIGSVGARHFGARLEAITNRLQVTRSRSLRCSV